MFVGAGKDTNTGIELSDGSYIPQALMLLGDTGHMILQPSELPSGAPWLAIQESNTNISDMRFIVKRYETMSNSTWGWQELVPSRCLNIWMAIGSRKSELASRELSESVSTHSLVQICNCEWILDILLLILRHRLGYIPSPQTIRYCGAVECQSTTRLC